MHWHLGKLSKSAATLSLSFLIWPWHAADLLPGRPSLQNGSRCSCSLESPWASCLLGLLVCLLIASNSSIPRGPPEFQLNPGKSVPDFRHLLMKRAHQVVAQHPSAVPSHEDCSLAVSPDCG